MKYRNGEKTRPPAAAAAAGISRRPWRQRIRNGLRNNGIIYGFAAARFSSTRAHEVLRERGVVAQYNSVQVCIENSFI